MEYFCIFLKKVNILLVIGFSDKNWTPIGINLGEFFLLDVLR